MTLFLQVRKLRFGIAPGFAVVRAEGLLDPRLGPVEDRGIEIPPALLEHGVVVGVADSGFRHVRYLVPCEDELRACVHVLSEYDPRLEISDLPERCFPEGGKGVRQKGSLDAVLVPVSGALDAGVLRVLEQPHVPRKGERVGIRQLPSVCGGHLRIGKRLHQLFDAGRVSGDHVLRQKHDDVALRLPGGQGPGAAVVEISA